MKSPSHRAMLRGDRNLELCPNSASNLGFELGNFECWSLSLSQGSGDPDDSTASVESPPSGSTFAAPYGSYLARIGSGSSGYCDGGTNKISKTISRDDLVAIKGVARWYGNDYVPFNDDGKIIAVYDLGSNLLFQASISQYGNYGTGPWIPFSFALPSGENEFTIEVSSTNKLDCVLDSAVYVDFAPIVVNPGGPYLVTLAPKESSWKEKPVIMRVNMTRLRWSGHQIVSALYLTIQPLLMQLFPSRTRPSLRFAPLL